MAAVMNSRAVSVRAAKAHEGRAIAGLWRELWDAHEEWGGYPGTRDARVYSQLAQRLGEDARIRAGHPVLGRHVHLVAEADEGVVGQVEGWFERHGVEETTPFTCEVRSLIVSQSARVRGAGRALLEGLARIASQMSRGTPVIMAAEVLDPNPADAFYRKVGYAPVAWTWRLTREPPARATREIYSAREAEPDDALAIALLEPTLAERRRMQGDGRFDRPREVDATVVGAIAAHLAQPFRGFDQTEIVVVDRGGVVRASASLTVMSLDPPFVAAKRGLLGRFAIDPALDPAALMLPLLRFGCRAAFLRGASSVELTDLDPPGFPLSRAASLAGATAWSRIFERTA